MNSTIKIITILNLFGLCSLSSLAQSNAPNDTAYLVKLNPVEINSTRLWKNDTARYRYNQMRYYVTTILPYLDAATALFKDMDAKMQDPTLEKKEKKRYVRTREDEVRHKFEDELEKLNITQGILLTKLIGRQTGANIYNILLEFKNPFTAIKWQTWARVHGLNLNKKYEPQTEPNLERIMESLDYPLPACYQLTAKTEE